MSMTFSDNYGSLLFLTGCRMPDRHTAVDRPGVLQSGKINQSRLILSVRCWQFQKKWWEYKFNDSFNDEFLKQEAVFCLKMLLLLSETRC